MGSEQLESSTPLRVVTAAAIFDGHDVAIGIFRRILQSQGCEVIHLGHDRGADEVARAAIQEDAHAIAITSYQGCLLYTSPSPRDGLLSRMPSSA